MHTLKKDYILKFIQSIRRWRNINFCFRALEYVRCIYTRNTWSRRIRIRSLCYIEFHRTYYLNHLRHNWSHNYETIRY